MVGLTVIVKVRCVEELHTSADWLTVMFAVTGDVPLLIPMNEAISPVPLAAKPMEGVLFVQL